MNKSNKVVPVRIACKLQAVLIRRRSLVVPFDIKVLLFEKTMIYTTC